MLGWSPGHLPISKRAQIESPGGWWVQMLLIFTHYLGRWSKLTEIFTSTGCTHQLDSRYTSGLLIDLFFCLCFVFAWTICHYYHLIFHNATSWYTIYTIQKTKKTPTHPHPHWICWIRWFLGCFATGGNSSIAALRRRNSRSEPLLGAAWMHNPCCEGKDFTLWTCHDAKKGEHGWLEF